ncbi:MAG: DMT family transporter [Rhodobacteraceae bacterium]|nr:DMT family transporter [Paracoccaceae bacterium]
MAISDNMRGAGLMMAAMAGFTLNDAFMKAVTQTLPLYQAIFLRGLLTLALLVPLAHVTGGLRLTLPRADRRLVGLRSVAEIGATVLFLTALMHMPLANLSAILQSLPLAVTLGAALFLGEPVGWRRLSAILIGFAGVLLIVRPGSADFNIWALAGVGAVACVVLRDLSTRRMSSALPSVTVAIYAAATVMLLGAAMTPFGGWSPVGPGEAGYLAAAAVCLVMGYVFIVSAARTGDIGTVAPFRYTALLWAIGLGWLVFGDFPDPLTLAGAAIVVATGIYTFHRERRLGRVAAAMPTRAPPPR